MPGFAETFLVDGKVPALGTTLKQEALAATLAHLAHAGLDDFYRGDVGREIAADLERIGSPVTRDDLERYRARLAEPLRVDSAGRHGLQHRRADPGRRLADDPRPVRPPAASTRPKASITSTAWSRRPSAPCALRDRVVTDPEPSRRMRSTAISTPRFLAGEAMKIDRRKAAPWPLGPGEGDTIWMGAADARGLVVSYIQSLYWEFGSGCVLPRTGVLMQNRGASFSLEPGALNPLAPGRLPFHTLNPALAVLKDGRVMAYGMHGRRRPAADARRRVHAPRRCFASRSIDALDRPRWVLGRTWGAARTALRLESRFDGNLIDRLAVGRPRCRGADGSLFRRHGARRRRRAAPGRHLRRRPRSARRWRRGRGVIVATI